MIKHTDHNAHVYAFRNAPYSAKPAWTRQRIAETQIRLAEGDYPSADAYYQDKDYVRELSAGLVDKKPWEHDPMGFWFGRQS
jgi:hypothetical protein